MSASTQKGRTTKKAERKLGVHVSPYEHETVELSVSRAKWPWRSAGCKFFFFLSRHLKTSPCPGAQEGVGVPAGCHVPISGFVKKVTERVAGFVVTRWRPRFPRAAGEASCPGGGGRRPALSGRCLVCGGSPASSACGGTSSDHVVS